MENLGDWMLLKHTRWVLLFAFIPVFAQAQPRRAAKIEPVISAVLSGPNGPLFQVGGGLKSYEIRYGWNMALTPNRGSGTFRSVAAFARQNVSDIFCWMAGAAYADYQFHPPVSDPTYAGPAFTEHTWHSLTPAVGLGVGYKFIFLELQAYYPGLLAGIRVGVN